MDRWDDDGTGSGSASGWGWGDGAADGGPTSFEDLYDEDVLAAIEAGPRSRAVDDLPPDRMASWRRRSALGAVLTGLALGYREVFDPEEQRSIVIEVDDEGEPGDLPVELFLDPDSATGSLCIVHRTDVPPPVV